MNQDKQVRPTELDCSLYSTPLQVLAEGDSYMSQSRPRSCASFLKNYKRNEGLLAAAEAATELPQFRLL